MDFLDAPCWDNPGEYFLKYENHARCVLLFYLSGFLLFMKLVNFLLNNVTTEPEYCIERLHKDRSSQKYVNK